MLVVAEDFEHDRFGLKIVGEGFCDRNRYLRQSKFKSKSLHFSMGKLKALHFARGRIQVEHLNQNFSPARWRKPLRDGVRNCQFYSMLSFRPETENLLLCVVTTYLN